MAQHLTPGLARLALLVQPETPGHLVMPEPVPLLVARVVPHLYHGQVPLVLLVTQEQLATQDLPAPVLHREILVEQLLIRGLALLVQLERLETLVQQVTLDLVRHWPMRQQTAGLDRLARQELQEILVLPVTQELVQETAAMVY